MNKVLGKKNGDQSKKVHCNVFEGCHHGVFDFIIHNKVPCIALIETSTLSKVKISIKYRQEDDQGSATLSA